MQTYSPNPIDPAFFICALLLLVFIVLWLIDLAFPEWLFHQRMRYQFKVLSKSEQYFRDLREGKVQERRKGDKWRSDYADEEDFEQFLVSLWRDCEYWYSRRLVQYHDWERHHRFIVHKEAARTKDGQPIDAIEFV